MRSAAKAQSGRPAARQPASRQSGPGGGQRDPGQGEFIDVVAVGMAAQDPIGVPDLLRVEQGRHQAGFTGSKKGSK